MAVTSRDDKVWVNSERRLRGICGEIQSAIEQEHDVLLLAHFEMLLRQMEAALRAASISFHSYSGFDDSVLFRPRSNAGPAVWVGLARNFHPRASPGEGTVNARRLSIIIAEHHPLPSRDQAIIVAAESLPRETSICFHAALTDALLVHFGSAQIKPLLEQLGLDEEDSLSHQLIDTAIRAAQEKIAKRVFTEMPTYSAEDWFKYNLREGV